MVLWWVRETDGRACAALNVGTAGRWAEALEDVSSRLALSPGEADRPCETGTARACEAAQQSQPDKAVKACA